MKPERWKEINQVFSAWLDLPPEKQSGYLLDACGPDEGLRSEVQHLIDAHLQVNSFIKEPVVTDVAHAFAEEEELLHIGQPIGAYKIVEEIGRGGMGAVYLAERADEQYKKQVAIKLIKRGMDTDQVLRRFRNERQLLANFDHPNIARLLEGGSTTSGLPYFVMEYVQGRTIDRYCDENNLSITKRLELFVQVCSAVSYAHRNLVVHRDIKPGNILVTTDGMPKLLDFGIAKILEPHADEVATMTGMLAMTPEYASPEQASGQNVTTLSDIYSLGVLLYELLTGHSPYEIKMRSPQEAMRIITETKPQLPSTIVNSVSEHRTPELVSKCREGTPDRLRRRLRGDLDTIVLMALRKEPERRYQSVEQFSEDIKRHLNGHPVIARKDTFLYRTTKFIKRNKIAALFAFVALLSIAVAGVVRWRTNQQAAMFQEFGQEVTRMEAIMRYSYLLPLHDTQPEKKQVLQRLEQIKQRMESLGTTAHGPGYYALGRGYLALHRYQEAYNHLIQAWEKYNYRHPQVASALGLSLAMLYQEKLDEAGRIYTKEQLIQRRADLEMQYAGASKEFIQKAGPASENIEYISALLAFLDKNYQESLGKATDSIKKSPWQYEALKLQADTFTAIANDHRDTGKTDEAIEFYDKAKIAYLEAAKKGQSDPQVYEGLCSSQSSLHSLFVSQKGTTPDYVFAQGINNCQKALQVDSRNVDANLLLSTIYRNIAYEQSIHGKTPSTMIEKSIAFAKKALEIDPENANAYRTLGNAYSTGIDLILDQEGDPTSYLDLADASFKKAITKMPQDPYLLGSLAFNFIKRANHYEYIGKDTRPPLDKAIQILQKSLKLKEDARSYGMLGHAYSKKANYERNVGVDPRENLKRSTAIFDQGIHLNPKMISLHTWAGIASFELAEAKIDYGENANVELDKSIDAFKKTLTLDPDEPIAYAGVGQGNWRKAEQLIKYNKNPSGALQAARDAFQKSISINNQITLIYALYAEVEVVAARYAMLQKRSPQPYFKETDRIIDSCFVVNREATECSESLASLQIAKAEYLLSEKKSPWNEIRTGIHAADRNLKLNADNSLVMAYRAKLYLLEAQSTSGDRRKRAAREAESAFEQAFKLRNTLRRQYENDWQSAKQLVQG
jgi:serine/threonine protein kinase